MPNKFQPINPGTSPSAMAAQMNANFARLDRETVTKVFKGATQTQYIQGQQADGVRFGSLMQVGGVDRYFTGLYREGRFGTISYDENGVPIALDGMAPDDGRIGKWVVKPGQNVIAQLGG